MLNSCLICTKTLQISLFRIFNKNIQQFQVIKIQVSCFKWYNCVKGIATIGNICYIRRLTQLGRCKQLNAHTPLNFKSYKKNDKLLRLHYHSASPVPLWKTKSLEFKFMIPSFKWNFHRFLVLAIWKNTNKIISSFF